MTTLGKLPQRAYGALYLRGPGQVSDDVDPHPSKCPPKNPQSLLMSGDHRDFIRVIVENEWASAD
ncbi:hypothetical protein GCM10009872_62470 [Actinopolymorpha rutila]